MGSRNGDDLERPESRGDGDDRALIVAEVLEVGGWDDVVGQGWECLPQHGAGAVPDETCDDCGDACLPGAAAWWRPQPDRGGDDEEDAEGGADRVGDDVAHTGVAAGTPLLQEFDAES